MVESEELCSAWMTVVSLASLLAELMEEMMAGRWVSTRVDLKDTLMAVSWVVMTADLKVVKSGPQTVDHLADRWEL